MEGFPWWNDAQRKLADEAKQVTDEVLVPMCERYAWKKEFPWEALKEIGKRGWFGLMVPEKYGGRMKECGVTDVCIIIEEISRAGEVNSPYIITQIGPIFQLVRHGTEDQKQRWLPRLATGELLGSITITEPFAGSDAAALDTTAVKDGDYYIVNGRKRFQTGSAAASIYYTYVKTSEDPERRRKHQNLTALIIEKGMPGFHIEKVNDLMGFDGIYNCYMRFDNVRVPVSNRIGEENKGWEVMMSGLNFERLTTVACFTGMVRLALSYAVQHLQRRVQFGTITGDMPTNQFKVADVIAALSLARLSLYYSAYCMDLGKDIPVQAAAAKLFATATALQSSIDAIQLMGGNGVTRYYPVERVLRDTKLLQIAAGTDEILRLVVYRMGLRDMMEDLKTPVRVVDEELKVPMPLGKRPAPEEVASGEDGVLGVLCEDYRVNPGLHMTMDDLKERLNINVDDLNSHLIALEKKGLVSLYRDRKGAIILARTTYKGLDTTNPLEHYMYIPTWVRREDLF